MEVLCLSLLYCAAAARPAPARFSACTHASVGSPCTLHPRMLPPRDTVHLTCRHERAAMPWSLGVPEATAAQRPQSLMNLSPRSCGLDAQERTTSLPYGQSRGGHSWPAGSDTARGCKVSRRLVQRQMSGRAQERP